MHRRCVPSRSPLAALLLLALAPRAGAPPRDLEVGVPPGSPTAWARWIPVLTPRREPVFPLTHAPTTDRTRTVSGLPRTTLDAQIVGSGVLRITTADVTGHLTWTNGPPQPKGPVTGPSARALPPVGAMLQWIGTAAFLRMLLHRQQVSVAEVSAHLVELGEPALWSVDAAAAERALAPIAADVRAKIDAGGGGGALPSAGSPRQAMLLRFVADELGRAHPYDPEGAFGRRLFVFADEVEPLLIRILGADVDPFLRRNAAAALGRYRTASAQAALVDAVADSKDMVVLMRALAALQPGCRVEPLLARLEHSTDPVETAALVAALGRVHAAAAVPQLLACAERGRRRDADLLMTALTALCRVPIGAVERGPAALANAVWQAARSTPSRFAVELPAEGPQPDLPDTTSLRGQILEQLALLLRLAAGDEARSGPLFEMLDKHGRGARGRMFANDSIGAFEPPTQMVLIETLPRLGAAGTKVLLAVVDDDSCDPVLRVAALARLPAAERDPIAERVLSDRPRRAPTELQLAAVQVLDLDAADALAPRCQELLRQCARTAPAAATASQRASWLAAVQALDRRSLLQADDLLPLLAHVRAATLQHRDPAAARRLEILDRATALVAMVAGGARTKAIDDAIAVLVDFVIAARFGARFSAATRADTIDYVRGLLAGVRLKRRDAAYQDLVVESIADYFVPNESAQLLGGAHEIEAVVPLEEAILLALGHTRAPAAVSALAQLLGDKELPCRAHVCLAAGATGDRSLAPALVQALLDGDGFVRFCAYEALRRLCGTDVWADWMYGDVAERAAAAQMWFRLGSRSGR